MRRAIASIILIIVSILIFIGCNSQLNDTDRIKYELKNGYTPTEIQSIIKDAIFKIYMPSNDEDIIEGVNKLIPIATESEINELLNTVGAFDKNRMAMISDLTVSVAMPENTSTRSTKYLATFLLSNDTQSINIMIEFGCDDGDMISTHSIWTSNEQ